MPAVTGVRATTADRRPGLGRPIRHVVFNPSARVSILQALKLAGRKDDVVALFDDLRTGPLDLSDLEARERWFDDVLRIDFDRGLIRQWHKEFWPKALHPDRRLIAWTTRHSVSDRIGFLVWASRLGETPAEVIDISDVVFEWTDWEKRPHRGKLPVPLITPAAMIEHGLFDIARPVTEQDRVEARQEATRLAQETGAFRAIIDGRLTTTPLETFDDVLIRATSTEFRKAAFVIGTVLMETTEADGWLVGDVALAARLAALVERGTLEAAGDPHGSIRHYEVRRPQADAR